MHCDLVRLSLACNDMVWRDRFPALGKLLNSFESKLTELDIRDSMMEIDDRCSASLAGADMSQKTSLGGNNFTREGCEIFLPILSNPSSRPNQLQHMIELYGDWFGQGRLFPPTQRSRL